MVLGGGRFLMGGVPLYGGPGGGLRIVFAEYLARKGPRLRLARTTVGLDRPALGSYGARLLMKELALYAYVPSSD